MLIIGTRGSALALAQSNGVRDHLCRLFPNEEIKVEVIKTSGDRDKISSLRTPASMGVFVKELEQALLNGEIDMAVHSMKDLPTQIPKDLQIAAVPEREDTRDAVISHHAKKIGDLPHGSRVGTGSLRRQAQLLALRPDLRIMDIRGNLDTRLRKLKDGDFDAIVLACAGLNRLGLEDQISFRLNHTQMLPAPGQGALAIEIRRSDHKTESLARALNHEPSAIAVSAERGFLEKMGGGCNVPVAVYARIENDILQMDALVASPDGLNMVRDSERIGVANWNESVATVAQRILSRGGGSLLSGS
jgi:hydroxymethylbilane synthase